MVRFKNRYILFEILFEDTNSSKVTHFLHPSHPFETPLNTRSLQNLFKEQLTLNFGDYGRGCLGSSLQVKYFSPYTNIGIVRVGRDYFHTLWATLTFITSVEKRECLFRVIHLGGTIKSCQQVAIKYDKDLLLKLQQETSQSENNSIEFSTVFFYS
ncbi:RNA-binding protein pop5 [Basidiobolus ranarum]|uniref:Ribonuclease P/MRP protein subunit POP5 n=1 Tax=Basidiobolus ranarum TaxID=34480 RepID=A0ABR2WY55_9FUNG